MTYTQLEIHDLPNFFQNILFLNTHHAIHPNCIQPYLYFTSVTSTNDIAKRLARTRSTCALVTTEYQTHGRGRQGNSWRSNPNDNLLFSFTLSPTTWLAPLFQIDLITLIAGLALHKTLTDFFSQRSFVANIKLKWPNDILINHKKICGILVEAVYYGHSLSSIVIGIGLNVNQTIFPTELANHTTSLLLETLNATNPIKAPNLTPLNRNDILQTILLHFFTLINHLSQAKLSRKEILHEAITRMQLLNQPVSFMWKDTPFCGTIMGINNEGKILIQLANQQTHAFSQNEIHNLNYLTAPF